MLCYKYRWRIGYARYRLKKRLYAAFTNDVTTPETREFDAYISFSSRDRYWVLEELLEKVEERGGLRLFHRNRDGVVGGNTGEEIIKAMDRCTRVLIIASNSYMVKEWSGFEMQRALLRHNRNRVRESHAAEVRNEVVVVKLEKLNRMSEEVARALDTHPHVEWTSDVTGQRLFWEQLVDLLRGKDVGFALNCYGCCGRGDSAITTNDDDIISVDDVSNTEGTPLLS